MVDFDILISIHAYGEVKIKCPNYFFFLVTAAYSIVYEWDPQGTDTHLESYDQQNSYQMPWLLTTTGTVQK